MKRFVVVSFYKFVSLPHFAELKVPFLNVMNEYNIKGTIILAPEGINGSFAAEQPAILALINAIHAESEFSDLVFKETTTDFNPFDKAKVKLRKEIVTMGVSGLNPAEQTGIHLNPVEWNQLLDDDDVIVIDTRNHYEVDLGTFTGAINPNTENFRDFPKFVQQELMDKKDKKIAMCCTGGIRCEKSTAYLLDLGFKEVYQLKDGILNYLDTISNEESKWQGTCFVFDERVALDESLNNLDRGTIPSDWKNDFKKKLSNG